MNLIVENKELNELIILAKISEKCPLKCKYCYEGDKSGNIMGNEVLEDMILKVENRCHPIKTTYIWHGAEPLTVGIEKYKKVRRLQKKFEDHHTIKNSMQTSGVLLTPELADFFVKEDFDLGFSLDGPEYVHNQNRVYFNNKPSFDDVINAIRLMQERGKRVGVIAVLTKKSLPYLNEIYDFFKNLNIDFKINPIMKCGYAKENDYLRLNVKERIWAITSLFDRWFFDNKDEGYKIKYNSVESIAKALFQKEGNTCDMMKSCQDSFLSIGIDGTVYPCSRFSDQKMNYGNILKIKNFKEVINNPLRQKLLKRYELNKNCHKCDYDFLCYSGCMHNSYTQGNIMNKDPNCFANQKIYEHVAKKIFEQLKKDNAIRRI